MDRLKKVLITPTLTIKQALQCMDTAGEKILFVTDDHRRLLGTVTDGDIRRWILKKKDLEADVINAMNKSPLFLNKDYSVDQAKNLMVLKRIDCIPVLSEDKKIISALWWVDLFRDQPKRQKKIEQPVIIMAGGEGTRLSPFTKILPKPLIPVGEKPIIEVIIDRFIDCGCKEFYLSLNYKSNLIRAYFADCGIDYDITYMTENKPLGTIGGLSLLKDRIKRTFFVSNCDILIDADYSDILRMHRNKKNMITIVSSMKHYRIPYGICQIENGGTLRSIQEKPEFDFLVNTGMYIMEPDILEFIPADSPYQITELLNRCITEDMRVGVYPVSERAWLDIGQVQELKNVVERLEKA